MSGSVGGELHWVAMVYLFASCFIALQLRLSFHGPLYLLRAHFVHDFVIVAAQIDDTLATSYTAGGMVPPLTELAWSNPAGSIFSTVSDMDKFINSFVMSVKNQDSPILSATSMREMLLPVYMNQDGWTVFSHPWESFFIQSYLVRCKGGNVDEYSGVTCVAPELGLTLNCLWSAGMDEFNQAVRAFEELIGPVRDAVSMRPVRFALPPNYGQYVGGFSLREGGKVPLVKITYSAAENALVLSQPGAQFWLSYVDFGMLALIPPPGTFPCETNELMAFPGELVVFSNDLNTFTLPGYGYGTTFYRV
eukprot:TRINITY_DN2580_c0_g1_i1.p1 TRINITY_DN2580_c0_g1~~TRINITY_DN2580_c0_g1_i1.p1  ORF type:complete len:306 (-),score=79.58 TRINITY_DN2580_c0_g1_i1:89-1006(-)